jgi:hypothetical protein
MRTIRILPAILMVSMSGVASAQDTIIVPPVPTSATQIQQWVMTVVGGVITVFLPLVALWLRNYLNSQAELQRAVAEKRIANEAIVHAAHLADLSMTDQQVTLHEVADDHNESDHGAPILNDAVSYVNRSLALSGMQNPGAADGHTLQAVVAEIHKLQLAKGASAPPSVVVSPVSAVR